MNCDTTMNSDPESEDSFLDNYDERESDNESLPDIFHEINQSDTKLETPSKTTTQHERKTESKNTVPTPKHESKKNIDSHAGSYVEIESDDESLPDIFHGINIPDNGCRNGSKEVRIDLDTPSKTAKQQKRRKAGTQKKLLTPKYESKNNTGSPDSLLVQSDSDSYSSLSDTGRQEAKVLQKKGGKRKIPVQKSKKTLKYTKKNSRLVQSDSGIYSSLTDIETPKAKTLQKQRGKRTSLVQKSKKIRNRLQNTSALVKSAVIEKPAKKIPFRRNVRGETPLHVACIRGSFERVQQIIDEGGHDINAKDNAGWTPLHEAANYNRVEIVDYLISHGADLNHECDGQTPLIDAAENGHIHVMKLLIQRGADTLCKDKEGHTALDSLLTWNERQNITDIEFLSTYGEVVGILKRKIHQTDTTGLPLADVRQKEEPSCSYTDVDGTEILTSGSNPVEKDSRYLIEEDQYYKTKKESEEESNKTKYIDAKSDKIKKVREKKSEYCEGHSEKKLDKIIKPFEEKSKKECKDKSDETKENIEENSKRPEKQIKEKPFKASKDVAGKLAKIEQENEKAGELNKETKANADKRKEQNNHRKNNTEFVSAELKYRVKENLNEKETDATTINNKDEPIFENSTAVVKDKVDKLNSETDQMRKGNVNKEKSESLDTNKECQEDEETDRMIVINEIDRELEHELDKAAVEVYWDYLDDTANSDMEIHNPQGASQIQRSQEDCVILNIGGQHFITSAATLKADPNCLFALLFHDQCPMRPYDNNTYFFDRDPTHFRFILRYLRNGAHIGLMMLPREEIYLLELLIETRFFNLHGLENIVLERLGQVTGSVEY